MTNIVPVPVKLVNEDGNAFSVISRVSASMKRNGQGHNVEQFREEATSGDYDHMLQACLKYSYDAPSDTLAQPDEDNEYVECEECGKDSESTPVFVINDRRFTDAWMCAACYDDAYSCPECGSDLNDYGECEPCGALSCDYCGRDDYNHSRLYVDYRDDFGSYLCDECYEDEMAETEEDDD